MIAPRMTLREAIDAIGAVLDPEASYHGGEVRIALGTHSDALRAMRLARDALMTMRSVEAGERSSMA